MGRAGLTLRPAAPGDADAIVALWEAAGLTRPWNDPHADLARALAGPASTVLVRCDEAHRLLGTVMVGHDGHRGWLYYLAVAATHRRAGLGRALVAAAEEWVVAAGIPKVQLMVRRDNAAVTSFYGGLGYDEQDVVVLGRRLEVTAIDPLRLGPPDAGELLTLQRAAYLREGVAHDDLRIPPLVQTLEDLRAELADPTVTVLGLREGGRLVGSVRWWQDAHDPGVLHIGRVAVAPDREGVGLGTSLLRLVEARAGGATELRLFTGDRNARALALYARLGYVETGRRPVGAYDLVDLAKRL